MDRRFCHFTFILFAAALFLCFGGCRGKNPASVPEYQEIASSYAFDVSDINKIMENIDCSFVALIEKELRTDYDNWAMPTTIYAVKVMENIKGELPVNRTIEIAKYGGLSEDKKTYFANSDDVSLEIGKLYVMNVFFPLNPNKPPLSSLGCYSNILLEDSVNGRLKQGAIAPEALNTSEIVQRYRAAYQTWLAKEAASENQQDQS